MSDVKIIEIPATYQAKGAALQNKRKLRVAAYCRVSTEEEEQQGSFEIQKLFYTDKIESVDVYNVTSGR